MREVGPTAVDLAGRVPRWALGWKGMGFALRSRKVTLAAERWVDQKHLWGGSHRGPRSGDEGQREQGCPPRKEKRAQLMVPTPAPTRRAEGTRWGAEETTLVVAGCPPRPSMCLILYSSGP